MAIAKPQELSVEILEHLRVFALSGGTHAFVSESKQTILDACDKLAKVNAIDASLLRANLYALTGEAETCEYWLRNAEKIGGRAQAAGARGWFLLLLGNVSEAYKYVENSIEQASSPGVVAIQLAACGLFRKAEALLLRTKAEIEPKLMDNITKACKFVEQLKISDEQICSVMDVTLGFLKEKGLIWLGIVPDFHFLPSSAGGPIVSLTYSVDVQYADAAKLNAELVDRLVASNLDSLGLIVGLRGSAARSARTFAVV